jgi:surfeit locus 1 family protein
MLAAVMLCATAAQWQGGRLAEKEALHRQLQAAEQAAPASELPQPVVTNNRYLKLALSGEYLPTQFLLDNQIRDSKAGFAVIAFFKTQSGQVITVNRGWQALPSTANARATALAPNLPNETVLQGRLNFPPANLPKQTLDPNTPRILPYLDLAVLRSATGLPLADFVIEQTAARDTLNRQWPQPDFKIETHRMYRGQWVLFGLLAVVLWLVFAARAGRANPAPT